MERTYFVPSMGYEFLYTHLPPGLLIVLVANERERQGQQGPSHKAKNAKKLYLFGRKVYSIGSLQLIIANHEALLGCYNFNSWSAMAKFRKLLPSESRVNSWS